MGFLKLKILKNNKKMHKKNRKNRGNVLRFKKRKKIIKNIIKKIFFNK